MNIDSIKYKYKKEERKISHHKSMLQSFYIRLLNLSRFEYR